jgi:3-oxoisoapionate decarboxylase
MRLGIGSYTFTWAVGVPGHPPRQPLTALGLLQKARQLGVRIVQFCDNLPLATLKESARGEVLGYASKYAIAIEIGTRGIQDADNLRRHLELAQLVGAPFVRVVVDSAGHEPSPEEIVARLRAILPEFASAGVKLAIENHDRFPSRMLAGIVEQLGPAHVGICLDTVNSFGALEGPELVVRTLAPYALNLHVKDFTITRVGSQMGYTIAGCPAGEGRLDLPWLLSVVGGLERDISAIIELWTPFGPELESTIAREDEWAERSVRHLRRHIPEE